MILHTVLFRLARPVSTESVDAFERSLRAFGAAAPHALGPAEVHRDLGLRQEGRSASEVSMRVAFRDEQAFSEYLASPEHVELVEAVIAPSCESWLSVQHSS